MTTTLQPFDPAPLTGHPRQCSANRSHGRGRCHAFAARGGTVCRVHGGAAPQVRAKNQQRLDELAAFAIREIAGVLSDADTSASDKIRAAEAILDRSGYPRHRATASTVDVDVKVTTHEFAPETLAEIQRVRATHESYTLRRREEMERMRAEGRERQADRIDDPDRAERRKIIHDAEIVEL